jgi:hypothetical protein
MESPDTSRTISTSVRPTRVAILINNADKDWMQTCLRIIEWTTCVWGGWYSCLIPTDGSTIDERFWQILEAFDPDYIYAYKKLWRDIKISHTDDFNRVVDANTQQFIDRYPEEDYDQTRHDIEQ